MPHLPCARPARLLLLILLLVALPACEEDAPRPESSAPIRNVAQTAECLPCGGHRFERTAETPTLEHQGQAYAFCSEPCREKFQAHPEQYVKAD